MKTPIGGFGSRSAAQRALLAAPLAGAEEPEQDRAGGRPAVAAGRGSRCGSGCSARSGFRRADVARQAGDQASCRAVRDRRDHREGRGVGGRQRFRGRRLGHRLRRRGSRGARRPEHRRPRGLHAEPRDRDGGRDHADLLHPRRRPQRLQRELDRAPSRSTRTTCRSTRPRSSSARCSTSRRSTSCAGRRAPASRATRRRARSSSTRGSPPASSAASCAPSSATTTCADFEGAVEVPIYQDMLSTRLAFRLTERDGTMENRCGNAAAGRTTVTPVHRAT